MFALLHGKASYRTICTGPPADRYADRPLLGGTVEIDRWQSISIGIRREREKEEEGEIWFPRALLFPDSPA
ncbi:hypothetical protein GW17_00049179 [Ensete ventricosum]|nr:hypothetical protein GW17_00049179 [Ensete ventricosum]